MKYPRIEHICFIEIVFILIIVCIIAFLGGATSVIVAPSLDQRFTIDSSDKPREGKLLYSDDFSDSGSGWKRSATSERSYGYQNGRYLVTVSVPNTSSVAYIPGSQTFKDFIVEVEAKAEEVPPNGAYGFDLRDNNGESYRLNIDGDGTFSFLLYKNGEWITLNPYTASSAIKTAGEINKIRISAQGDTFTIYVNGVWLGECSDSSLSSGEIALKVGTRDDGNVKVSFDNLKVWAIPLEETEGEENREESKQELLSTGNNATSIPKGTIYGHVRNASTLEPISVALVDPQVASCSRQTTNGTGYYAIENCFSPLATYKIQCSKPGYKTATKNITTDADGNALADFDLEIEGGSHSGNVSGRGSIQKDYYIINEANDSAKVSVDIRNATYYEYKYNIFSDETQCIAGLDLIVEQAESIKCSGESKNRSSMPADMIALVKNGNLTYSSSIMASNQGVQASQDITDAWGDTINASGTVRDYANNIIVSNNIAATSSESFRSAQKISTGNDTSTQAKIVATTGPLNVSSHIGAGERKLYASLDVASGIVSIDQQIDPFQCRQDSEGIIGGASFNTMIENAKGDKAQAYTAVGSGNLTGLSQRASGDDAGFALEYEYLPVSYSTGVYDMGYMEGGSGISSDKSLASKVISENCESMAIMQEANFNGNPWINTSLVATTGPLNVSSYLWEGDRRLNATADVDAGELSINQLINLTIAQQSFAGVIGGAGFDTMTTGTGGKRNRAHTSVGSGSLDLFHLASLGDALYMAEYEYMPVSYQTGTYDRDLNSSEIERLPQAIEVSTIRQGQSMEIAEGESAPVKVGSDQVKLPTRASLIETSEWGEVPVNQVLVVLRDGKGRSDADRVAASLGGQVVGFFGYINLYQIETAATTEAELKDAVTKAKQDADVELAFPNQQSYPDTTVQGVQCGPLDDPVYSEGGRGKGYEMIGVQRAWDLIRVSGLPLSKVHVGVVDDGLYKGNDEFNGEVKIDTSEPHSELEASLGKIFDNKRQLKYDYTISGSHGTGVMNIIAADPYNGGITGIASQPLKDKLTVSMVNYNIGPYGINPLATPDPNDPTKVLWHTGRTFALGCLLAINERINEGATIISCSWGAPDDIQTPKEMAAAFKKFFEKMAKDHPDVLFVCAAGNNGKAPDGTRSWPCGLNLPNMITVGNVMNDGTKAASSNMVSANFEVTLAAPGTESVYGFDNKGGIENSLGGTSMATPQVTSAAALIRALNPGLTAGQIKDILVQSARTSLEIDGKKVPAPPELGGRTLAIDQAVFNVINDQRNKLGLEPFQDMETALASARIDLVAENDPSSPHDWKVTAQVSGVGANGADVTLELQGEGAVGGDTKQHLTESGTLTWNVTTKDSAMVVVKRLDTNGCSRINLISTSVGIERPFPKGEKGVPETDYTFSVIKNGIPDDTQYTWSFGDGGTDRGEKVIHSFTASGKYKVEVKASWKGGSADADTEIEVAEEKPTPQGCPGVEYKGGYWILNKMDPSDHIYDIGDDPYKVSHEKIGDNSYQGTEKIDGKASLGPGKGDIDFSYSAIGTISWDALPKIIPAGSILTLNCKGKLEEKYSPDYPEVREQVSDLRKYDGYLNVSCGASSYSELNEMISNCDRSKSYLQDKPNWMFEHWQSENPGDKVTSYQPVERDAFFSSIEPSKNKSIEIYFEPLPEGQESSSATFTIRITGQTPGGESKEDYEYIWKKDLPTELTPDLCNIITKGIFKHICDFCEPL